NATGALQTASAIKLSLPVGLTFNGVPTVSLEVANGASPPRPIPTLESPGTISFTLDAPSTTGPARILVSGISVTVPSTFLPVDAQAAAVVVTISGPNPGLTPAAVQNAMVQRGAGLTDVSPDTAAQGVSGRAVTITGVNFAADATVSFGTVDV